MTEDAEKDTQVVALNEGIDFDQNILGWDNKPLQESYFEDEDEERGEWLQSKRELTGSLSPDEAEELLGMRKKRPIKMGDRCVICLNASLQDDKADGVQKLKRFNLSRKLQGSADPDAPWATVKLNSKQKTMILKLAEQVFNPLYYGRIHEALEGSTEGEEDE